MRSVHFRVLFPAVVNDLSSIQATGHGRLAAQKKSSTRTRQRVPHTAKTIKQQADIKIISIQNKSTE